MSFSEKETTTCYQLQAPLLTTLNAEYDRINDHKKNRLHSRAWVVTKTSYQQKARPNKNTTNNKRKSLPTKAATKKNPRPTNPSTKKPHDQQNPRPNNPAIHYQKNPPPKKPTTKIHPGRVMFCCWFPSGAVFFGAWPRQLRGFPRPFFCSPLFCSPVSVFARLFFSRVCFRPGFCSPGFCSPVFFRLGSDQLKNEADD